ncbi:MAG: hypothetical protein R3E42_07150 [Burkholderiaceae bacterium]
MASGVHICLAAGAGEAAPATGIEHGGQHRVVAEGGFVHADRFFSDLEHADAFDTAGVPVKYFLTVSLSRPMASNNWAPQYDM